MIRDELIELVRKEQKYPLAPGAFADKIINLFTGKITGEMLGNIKLEPGATTFTLLDAINGNCNIYTGDLKAIANAINKALGKVG